MPIRAYTSTPPRPGKKPGRPRTQTTALVPAAARRITLTHAEDALNGEAVETFLKVVGGRAKLTDVLSVASTAPEVEAIVNHLLDHRYRTWSLRKICALTGITVADLFTAYRKALITASHIEASHIIASKLPPIVIDVMTRATPQEVACSCQGKERARCPICHGTGVTLSEPDLDRQKLALELGHLTEKKAGLIVQQNQGVMTGGGAALVAQGHGALEQLQQAVGDILFSPARKRKQSPITDPLRDIALPLDPPIEHPPQDDPDADAPSVELDEAPQTVTEVDPPLPFD